MSKREGMPAESAKDGAPSVWSAEPAGRRSLTRDAIVGAALELADAEGLEAVSMRSVAGRLGVHATSLYWHVKTKDDLVDLMIDATVQEQLMSGELPEDRVQALTAIAEATYGRLLRHPWLAAELGHRRALVGPNTLRHLEQSLTATIGRGLDEATALDALAAVDSYVLGYAIREISGHQAAQRSGITDEQWLDTVGPHIETLLATGNFPHLAALDPRRFTERTEPHHQRFARGLDMLIHGLLEQSAPTS